MAALLALRFIWLIGHDALWNPPPCGGPGFRSDASTEPAHTRHTQSEKRGRPHGWRGSTELQRTDASTTHLAERLLLGRQLLLWLGLHLRGVLHEHGLVHQILYEGAARGRQLLCGTRDAPSVGPPGLGRCSTRARAGGRSAPARRERDAAMVLQYSLLNLAASATQTYAE